MFKFRSFASLKDFLQRTAPASHLTAFLLLHELTALLPLPAIYYTLQSTNLHVPIPQDVMQQAELKIDKVMTRYGWGRPDPNGGVEKTRMVMDMATSYAFVKVLMPVRLGVSMALTPWFARRAIVPMRDMFTKLFRKSPQLKQ
ncbi:hypothetical protein HDU98_003922 [Podochytrium sp. JEL0797]|nr:hypothetical protein HDU98_007438 [Podochytrium sp. JEL0797]KAJ3076340.1 hypothetical protein HDU98_003922 [Podochytrium sp. JEL0797]